MKALLQSLALLFLCAMLTACGATSAAQSANDTRQKREELYRRNNLGVALMEQFKHEEAAKEFKQALTADANFALGRINLALAAFFLNDSRTALNEAREAVKLAPDNPHAHYVLGLALRNEKLYDEAVSAFNKVLAIDPRDPASNIQIGQLHAQKQQYEPALTAFRRALEAEPYNQTAAYSLAQALIRAGKTAEGQQMLTRFQQLRASGYATSLGNVYGEKGRYGEAATSTGAEAELVTKEAPSVKFVDATAAMNVSVRAKVTPLAQALGRKLNKAEFNNALKRELVAAFSTSVQLGDYDGDQRLDIIATALEASGQPFARLLHNDGGKFTDVSDKAKLTLSKPASGAVCGDFDNDGKNDLVFFGYQTLALWRNNGDGAFTDVTAQTGLPVNYTAWALTAAWVDADHDGDLDLFIGNFADLSKWPNNAETAVFPDDFAGAENKLYRNNGTGTFTDITAQAGLDGGKNKTTAVVGTDFNNQRDLDLLVVNYGGLMQMFSNQRDGTFKDVAQQTGLQESGKALSVGAGDLNKDNFTDFYLVDRLGEPLWYLSDGRGKWQKKQDAGLAGRTPEGNAVQLADYDNDGLLDVLELNKEWLRVRRNTGGNPGFGLGADELTQGDTRAFATGDLNDDGAVDVLTFNNDGALTVLRNEGAGKNYVRFTLAGKTSNRSAVGAKIELRSGSLRQKLEVYSAAPAPAATSLNFGLGYRTAVDAVQLLWPAGIVQSELTVKASANNAFDELDRKGTSCPLLYAWNGNEYSFVTDFLGGSAIGYLTAPGRYNYPDTDEYVRVTGEQLKERDGVYSLRLNNQLEEVIFFDAVKLLALDHPAETDVYPNERLLPAPPYPPFKIYSVKAPHAPVAAVDEQGRDVLPLLTQIDRRFPEAFEKLPFKGYAREHALTLDLGAAARQAARVLLLLTAWIDYADSTANLAASQAGVKLVPPYLQVKNARGEWQTVLPQIGFPAGLPKTMTVDLTGKFLGDATEVRIVTSMRIYWDQILVDISGGAFPTRVTMLEPMKSELRWRGFPHEHKPEGRAPLVYDYRVIEPCAPWKAHLGNYTRYGKVRELLLAADDMYVITRNGDELQVDFAAQQLPPLPQGWRRDFLLYADGFGKDMDINSARPETIGELPYHGMKSYPYAATDRYPLDARRRKYLEQYNTRTVSNQREATWRGVR